MKWNSLGEFLAMGGYAFYVWGSFGACAALMIVEPILVRLRRKNALQELKREIAASAENNET
ncbi:MAG: heme exporter protein CcmD [Rhodocyclaceae bacterium]|jgi:heme exporter protein D|nr:heme exporter protein CcmD [Rhodocyclaceae bacterium]